MNSIEQAAAKLNRIAQIERETGMDIETLYAAFADRVAESDALNVNQLSIAQMRFIYEVSKTMSVTDAAKALYASQPFLSKKIIEAESLIGYQIFERSGKHMRGLTLEGERALAIIRAVLMTAQQLRKVAA